MDEKARDKFFRDVFNKTSGRFFPEWQTKSLIAHAFLRDADDLLEMSECAWESARDNRSYRSKIFMNLRMAYECVLKSLIVAYSKQNESPEDAYDKARKAAHKLATLLAEAKNRSGKRRSLFSKSSDARIRLIDTMKVGLRYEIDLVAAFGSESVEQDILQSGPMSSTIGSGDWMIATMTDVGSVIERARKVLRKRFKRHSGVTGTNASKRWARFNAFFAAAKII